MNRLYKLLSANLISTLTFSVGITLFFLGGSFFSLWQIYRGVKNTITEQFYLQENSQSIIYFDEVLTMSARMAASTGDSQWEQRYRQFEPMLNGAIEEIIKLYPPMVQALSQTDKANVRLIELENQAFILVKNKKKEQALKLLMGGEYQQQKDIYAQGIQRALESLKIDSNQKINNYIQLVILSLIFIGVALVILIFNWSIVVNSVKKYLIEKASDRQDLINYQNNLLDVNEQLKNHQNQILLQEQLAKQETEMLQGDIAYILNVVSKLQEGDFTEEANVTEGIIGLVADMLNQLIERLRETLNQVNQSSLLVLSTSNTLEVLANDVASQSKEQAEEATKVWQISKEIKNILQLSAGKLHQANQSLAEMSTTVTQGQEVINNLDRDINILQQGTNNITQQMELLEEFVKLSDRVLQEQHQTASLTQMLAINASMVVARALSQQDPTQWIVIVKEFEALAGQIQDLAKQTNLGLKSLEDGTSQVHDMAQIIQKEVKTLAGLVNNFSTTVEESDSLFTYISKVNQELVETGRNLTKSQKENIKAALITAKAMNKITQLSESTANLTAMTKEKSEEMGAVAAGLQKNISFFSLGNNHE